MPIFTVKGNLVSMAKSGKLDVIVHGCNCHHAMSGGIAAEIANRCPTAKFVDFFTPHGEKKKLGKISYALEETDFRSNSDLNSHGPWHFMVVNAYTQFQGGPDFRMKALTKCLKKIKKQFGGMNLRIGFPLIGAGIGGGNWAQIKEEIDNVLGDEKITIVEFDGSK